MGLALKLTGIGYSSSVFTPDDYVTQTVGVGSTAVGRVVLTTPTGVLKTPDRTGGFNSDGSLVKIQSMVETLGTSDIGAVVLSTSWVGSHSQD